jgi:hypothetical protein
MNGKNARTDRRRVYLIGLASLLALTLVGAVPASGTAEEAQLCAERSTLLKQLEQSHAETPQALGLTAGGAVIELLVSPTGGWTLLATYPKQPTCVIAAGRAWQMLPAGGPAA